MKVAVVILNWNGVKFLGQFLPSVIANSPEWARIVVADNASTDGSVAFVKQQFPSVEIIENPTNLGFAGGYNLALEQVHDEYVVLLNSDVEVSPGWLEPIIVWMDNEPNMAACQPKILAFHDKKMFEYAGGAGGYIDAEYYAFCRGRIFDNLEEDLGQYNDYREVAWASGCAMVVRKTMYDKAGALDGDFFAHMEEIDLCLRLKIMGHSIGYCPASVVYHVGGGTLNKISPFKTYLNYRNNLYMIVKNHYGSPLSLKVLWRLTLDGVSACPLLLKGEFGNINAILKAHFHFYKNLGKFLKKRKKIRQTRGVVNRAGMYNQSILWDYFIRGRKKFSEINIKS